MPRRARAERQFRFLVAIAAAAVLIAAFVPLQEGRLGLEAPSAQMQGILGAPGALVLGLAPAALAAAALIAAFRARSTGGALFVLLATGAFVLAGALIPLLEQLGPPRRGARSYYWGAQLPLVPLNLSFLLLCLVTLFVAEHVRATRPASGAARALGTLAALAFLAGLGLTEIHAAGGAADLFLLDYPLGLGSNGAHVWVLRCVVLAAAGTAIAGLVNAARREPSRWLHRIVVWGAAALALLGPVGVGIVIRGKSHAFGLTLDTTLTVYGVLLLFGAALRHMLETAWAPTLEEVFA